MEKIKDSTHPFKDRLANVMKLLDIKTKADFYRTAKIDPAQFYRVTDGFQNPGFGFLEKMAVAFPQLNIGWFLSGEGEMILDRVNDTEKTILENYRKLPDEGKIGFEVRTSLYEREYSEHKELMGNIVDVAMNNENKLPFMSWELYNRLQVLQNLRVNKIISIQKGSSEMTVLSSSDLKSQLENTEAGIQKLISLDAEYMNEFLTQKNEE